MNGPPKRKEPLTGGSERDSKSNSASRHPNTADGRAMPSFNVVAIKSTGKRAILCAALSRADAERWVALHRPFAVAAGGDVLIEPSAVRKKLVLRAPEETTAGEA